MNRVEMQMSYIALAGAIHMGLLIIVGGKIFIDKEVGLLWEMQVF